MTATEMTWQLTATVLDTLTILPSNSLLIHLISIFNCLLDKIKDLGYNYDVLRTLLFTHMYCGCLKYAQNNRLNWHLY